LSVAEVVNDVAKSADVVSNGLDDKKGTRVLSNVLIMLWHWELAASGYDPGRYV